MGSSPLQNRIDRRSISESRHNCVIFYDSLFGSTVEEWLHESILYQVPGIFKSQNRGFEELCFYYLFFFLFVSSFILTLLTENNPQEISSFSLTQPLIFVHGRVCIRRTAWISMLISKHCSLIVLWVGDLCVSPLKCQILFLKKNMATPISVHALSTSSSWTKHKTSSDLCV